MARQTFTAGAVLTATQMNALQASVWSDDVNTQTGTSYTLVLTDAGKQVTMSNASANTLTIPLNSSVAFTIGTRIWVINLGAGVMTLAAAGGVTVNSTTQDFSFNQNDLVLLFKTGTDSWLAFRDLDTDDDQNILSNQVFG